jgi:transcriptional regulator with GAF, ATPase, and Fis domain
VPDAPNLRLLDLLSNLAEELCKRLAADGCVISRVIGDVLIMVAERAPEGVTLQQGQGYLVPDFPTTAEVLATGRPCTLTLDEPGVDEAEAEILRFHGFGALLMLPLTLNESGWGLVELYRKSTLRFSDEEMRLASELARIN